MASVGIASMIDDNAGVVFCKLYFNSHHAYTKLSNNPFYKHTDKYIHCIVSIQATPSYFEPRAFRYHRLPLRPITDHQVIYCLHYQWQSIGISLLPVWCRTSIHRYLLHVGLCIDGQWQYRTKAHCYHTIKDMTGTPISYTHHGQIIHCS